METIVNEARALWRKYAALLIAPVLAAAVSLSYFIVKSEDFLTVQSSEIPKKVPLPEIIPGQKYVQEINSVNNGLSKINLLVSAHGRIVNNSNLYISLSDTHGNVIQKWQLSSKNLKDILNKDKYRPLILDRRIENSNGQKYYLTVVSDAAAKGITLWSSKNAAGKGLSLNGKNLGSTLCYRLTYRLPYANLFSWANGFHIAVLFVLAYIVFTLLPHLSKIGIEQEFLIIWVSAGLMFLFSATLFNAPDERAHLCRSFDVSYGRIVSSMNQDGVIGGELQLPPDMGSFDHPFTKNWQSFSDVRSMNIPEEFVFHSFYNTALYSPASYIPQSLGIWISRHLTDNLAVIIYSGRLFNWIFNTLVLYSAIRIIPAGKEILALIALMPMNIQESVSYSPDGQVVSVTILMVALVLHLRHKQQTEMDLWQYGLLLFLALLISQLKIVYLPFIILYFIIQDARFGSRKKKLCCIGGIILMAVMSNLIWLKVCSRFLVARGNDSTAQLIYIISHPLDYLDALARAYFNWSLSWVNHMVGLQLSWLSHTTLTVGILVQIYICILVYKFLVYKFFINRKKSAVRDTFETAVFCFVIVSVALLIATSEYLYWTDLGSNVVIGILGRYYTPLLLPLFFVLNNYLFFSKEQNVSNNMSVNVTSFITCINFCACVAILFRCVSLYGM